MKTMLDKIGIIGDVKTAFNRLGIDTLAVVLSHRLFYKGAK